MSLFKNFALLATVFSTVSASLYNLPLNKKKDPDNIKDEMIFIRGKNFHSKGKSSLSAVAETAPQTYTQCMDHFDNSSCSETWQQRYWVNTNDYQPGSPIFFMLGAEGPADGSVDGYIWQNYAQQYNAVLVCLEHRFYGESIPTSDTSLKSLQLLTSRQALEDGARFIADFKKGLNGSQSYEGAPVVVFGGSYGGNLAAWFRQKFPGSANVAVASSAPVEAKFDFTGYMKTVSEVIYWNNSTCFFNIRDAFTCMENLVHGYSCSDSQTTSSSQIPTALHQCDAIDFSNEMEKEGFFFWLAMDMWASNYPKTEDMSKCGTLDQQTGNDVLTKYGNFLSAMGQGENCTAQGKSRKEKVRDFLHSKEGLRSGAAGWFWQTCNEFGYYQTADPDYQVFGTDFTPLTYVQECQNEYGSMFTSEYIQQRIDDTNEYYKGKQNDGTCIIFVNGLYDPWHSLGIYQSNETSSSNSVVTIGTGEHCEDMGFADKADTEAAQSQIQTLIGQYLANPACVSSS